MKRFVVVLLSAVAASGLAQLRLDPFVTGLEQPVEMVQDPTLPNVQYVVQKTGLIRVIQNGAIQPQPLLDVVSLLNPSGEKFLFSLVLAPDYGQSGHAYICYVAANGEQTIARYTRSTGNPLQLDASTRRTIMAMPTSIDHWGGTLRFGPDGYLYLGTGDGSGGNDPNNNAQNPNGYHGKMLRIDPSGDDFPADPNRNYAIPPDNPFLSGFPVSALPEIWAFGLRNPWKWSFDSPALGGTGAMLIGDVGQNGYEEIDFAAPGQGGLDFGWRQREGAHDSGLGGTPAFTPLTDPIYDYLRGDGASVTGGYVYRGRRLSEEYRGRYFFGDFVRGSIVSFHLKGGEASNVVDHSAELGSAGLVSSIHIDSEGEIYVTDFGGSIRKLVQRTISGHVSLLSYSGTVQGVPIVVEIRNVGSPVPLESHTAHLAADGSFVVGASVPDGNYDIAVKSVHWLRQRLANRAIGHAGLNGLAFSLKNADINGDNTVSIGDFNQLRNAFGSSPGSGNWNPNADLNGDGTVSLGDFNILRLNFGMSGDP